jgi:ABC-type branched-subunit amino acid transport system ATPase component/ABC-type branched-subunit amino acid transport system permease subunit
MSPVDIGADLYLLLAALGLSLSVQYADLPILGQSAFVAVGGFGTLLLASHGLPLGAAVALSVLIAAAGGYLLALGAARLYGASLALATWALAWLVQAVLLAFPSVFGGSQGLVQPAPARLESPSLGVAFTLSTTVHLVIASVACALTLAALHRIDRGPLGLDLAAMREGPALAASLGVRVGGRRRTVLATTAALGALGGAGSAVLLGTVAPSDVGPLLSVQLLVAVLLAGTFRPYGVVAGFAVIAALPHVADAIASAAGAPAERVRGALTAGLLVFALAVRGTLRRFLERFARPRRVPSAAAAVEPRAVVAAGVRLRARGLRLTFGAVHALDGVDLDLCAGEVHALVGPNGSGKSTLLRVLAGALRPDVGSVSLTDARAPHGQAANVRAGIARTPQQTVMLARLSPLAQVAVGARVSHPVRGAGLRHLLRTPSSMRAAALLAGEATGALELVGMAPHAEASVAALGAGEQRLLQVARAAATGAPVLLLDEPSAGMTSAERQRLAGVIRTLAGNGTAVCLVEHDMALVAAVAHRVTVLDAGRVLVTGDPLAVRQDARVRLAYLGDAAGA